ncbi:MAG TPA: alcohol dehydrogenase catalytic domain-containing protein [Terriglobia bacterium]|nr:alcohol dehydrogenase catalytic domain-containing protein [Terriglobia bacterium]
MKAAILEDVQKMVVRRIPDPALARNEVMIQVQAVGVCGTDLHIFRGRGNYNLDARGRIIPLAEQPQILGHEFSGRVIDVGKTVTDLEVGDRVLCDEGRNCFSQEKWPLCSYCVTGDSHQCEHYREHGITGLQGALAEYIAMPAVNCLKLPDALPTEHGALVEPLGCIVHSSERAESAGARYSFAGQSPIQNILICGAGPAGLLFLQYLRSVTRFEGLILISDVRQKNLDFARDFGGTPINVAEEDLPQAVQDRTHGERIHYLIESCGNSIIFEQMPSLLRKQATVLLYGHGHNGRDIGLLGNVLFLEPTLVASAGASGGFEADGRPATFRRALELVSSGKIRVQPFVTHRYTALEDIHLAFERDFQRAEYIKGELVLQ